MAAQAGRRVTICEPKPGDIDKACGEGLMPGAVDALHRLGVTPKMTHPFRGIRYIDKGRVAEGCFPSGVGAGVRRTVLHDALRDRAAELGVRWEHRRVKTMTQHEEHVTVDGMKTRWVLAADGLHSPTRKRLGLDIPHNGRARLGIRRHFAMEPWSDFVEVYWTKGAEAYVTPLDPISLAWRFCSIPSLVPGMGKPIPETDTNAFSMHFLSLRRGSPIPVLPSEARGPLNNACAPECRVVCYSSAMLRDTSTQLLAKGFALDWPPHTPPSAVS